MPKTALTRSSKKMSLSNKSAWAARLQSVKTKLLSAVLNTFLLRTHLISLLIILAAAAACVLVIVIFLFLSADNTDPAPTNRQRLETDRIDRLELWIETRQGEYEQPVLISPDVFSKS